jgi:hypothetical protein
MLLHRTEDLRDRILRDYEGRTNRCDILAGIGIGIRVSGLQFPQSEIRSWLVTMKQNCLYA